MSDHSAFAQPADAGADVSEDASERPALPDDRAAAKRISAVEFLNRVLAEADAAVHRAEKKLAQVTDEAAAVIAAAAAAVDNAEADRMKALEELAAAESAVNEGAS